MALCKWLDYTRVLTVETFIVPSSHRPASRFFASGAFFMLTIIKADKQNYAHTHTPRQTHTHTYIYRERGKHLHFLTVEKGRFSSQHRSSLSNPSVAEKEPSQPFLLNPLPSKSSARPRLRHTHSCFCHLRGHRFDSFLTLKDRFAQITQKKTRWVFLSAEVFPAKLLLCKHWMGGRYTVGWLPVYHEADTSNHPHSLTRGNC